MVWKGQGLGLLKWPSFIIKVDAIFQLSLNSIEIYEISNIRTVNRSNDIKKKIRIAELEGNYTISEITVLEDIEDIGLIQISPVTHARFSLSE